MSWKKDYYNFIYNRDVKPKEDEEQRRKEREEQRQKDALQRLHDHFKCLVCGKRASRPKESLNEGYDTVHYDTNWDLPGDLYKCKKCGNWACIEHYDTNDNICMYCAQKEMQGKRFGIF